MQRADKRSGSFSFLTWSFFIAPLIACEEFLAAMFKSAAAEEEGAKTAQAAAAPQAANDHPPTSDLSKTSAEDVTAKGPAASSEAHAAQLDPTGLLAQSHEDAPKPSTARNEAVADASSGGGGGGGDDADSRHHGAHTSIDGSSVNSLSADSHFGSSLFPGGSTLESVQSIVLGGSFSPAITGSAPPLGTVGGPSNDVMGGIAPVEAAVPPVLTTVGDTVGTLTHDVAGTLAPVEAAVPPVLTTVGDTVGTLTHDVAGTLAPVEAAAVQPVLTHVTDTVSAPTHDVLHPADTGKVSETLASAVPVGDTTEPVLASAGVSHSNPTTDLLHPAVADTGAGQAAGPADTLLALATATDAPIELPGSATAAPANVATGASNAAAAVHPSAIAGDVIALNDASPSPAHALFTGSQYTDYGVALSSGVSVPPPQHAVSPADTTSAHDTLVPVVADAQKHAPPPPDIVDTTHSIDHLGHAML
ncbi:MAG TPA: hypothetical protein VN959_21190 [Mycobacterium sp.]|nr:hypothetical protein [Mycobacterium sp.]